MKPSDTKDSTPYIEWGPGYDADDDQLEYYIQIGTSSGAADILSWTSAGLSTHYQLNKNMIVGTYYVQIKVFDGLDNSSVFQHLLNITATGGDPPKAPSAIYPDVTSDHTPRINWSAPPDSIGQQIFYLIQIGTSPGVGDVLSWYPMGPQLEYQIQYDLPDGIYYVQVMSMTDNGTSPSHEETIKIATFNPELKVKNKITAKQGENVIATINLKNNCSVDDSITINITSELFSTAAVSYSLNPKSPVLLLPYEAKNITLLIQLPSSIKTGDYQIDFTAISEDGVSKSFTRTLVLNIGRADGKKPTNGDGDSGDETEEFKLAGLPIIVWILLIIVIIVLIGLVMAALAIKKKRESKEKAEFFQEREAYEKLYGPRQGRGGGGKPGGGGGTGSAGESDLDYYYDK
jgi:methionine-rich copper-binding protein CopC